MNKPVLLYFVDPMCSWCWGFTPVIEQIKATFHTQMDIALMLGGLRPDATDPMTHALREEILHHWHQVASVTKQPFTFAGALPDGFVYNTEPACRAVIAAGAILPDAAFALFKSIQSAFYTENVDVTQAENLADLAQSHAIDRTQFLHQFESKACRQLTHSHFVQARGDDVRGFPSLITQHNGTRQILTRGYCAWSELQPKITSWLADC